MTFRRTVERIDMRTAAQCSADETAYIRSLEVAKRAIIGELRSRYNAVVVAIREVSPKEKLPAFEDGNFGRMDLDALAKAVSAQEMLVEQLDARLLQLREQVEAKRRADLSEVEALREDMNSQFAVLRGEIAALRAMYRQRRDVPDLPAAPLKASNAPPMVMANSQRGGGVISTFEEVPPSRGGVRRIG